MSHIKTYLKMILHMNGIKLIDAVEKQDIDKVKELINSGIDINTQDKYGQTALIKASHIGNIYIVKELIKAGADVDIQGNYGETALIWAAYSKHDQVTFELIEAGADWNKKNNRNNDFLYYNYKIKNTLAEKYPEKYKEYLIKKDTYKYNI